MNLVEELKERKVATKISVNTTPALVQTQKLLEYGAQEDLQIARMLGKKHSIARAEDIVGRDREMEKLEKEFGDNVFHIKDIQALCVKYNLRFLSSQHYAGVLDVQAVHKIKQFAKDSGIQLNAANMSYNVFIMAPPSTFDLENYKAERIKLQFPDTDPIMFYKLDGGDNYKMIHKWGKDFTWTRRISGFLWASVANRVISYSIMGMLLAAISVAAFTNGGYNWFYLLAGGAIGAFTSVARFLTIEQYSDVQQFFTKHNWNSVRKVN